MLLVLNVSKLNTVMTYNWVQWLNCMQHDNWTYACMPNAKFAELNWKKMNKWNIINKVNNFENVHFLVWICFEWFSCVHVLNVNRHIVIDTGISTNRQTIDIQTIKQCQEYIYSVRHTHSLTYWECAVIWWKHSVKNTLQTMATQRERADYDKNVFKQTN